MELHDFAIWGDSIPRDERWCRLYTSDENSGLGLTKRLAGQNRLHGQRRGWGEERKRPEEGGSPVPLPLSPTLLKNTGPGAKMVKAAKPALQSDPARFMGCGVA